jgi:hypothetical protein
MRQGGCRWRVRALPHGRFGYTNQTAADSGRLQADVLVRPDERAGEADGRLPEFAYPRARAAVPRGELCARAVRRKFRQSVRPTVESCVCVITEGVRLSPLTVWLVHCEQNPSPCLHWLLWLLLCERPSAVPAASTSAKATRSGRIARSVVAVARDTRGRTAVECQAASRARGRGSSNCKGQCFSGWMGLAS